MRMPHLEPGVAPPRRYEAVQRVADIDRRRIPMRGCAGGHAPGDGHRLILHLDPQLDGSVVTDTAPGRLSVSAAA
jgi:hypothetical protein